MSVPRPPLRVALTESVSVLPRWAGLAYEPNNAALREQLAKRSAVAIPLDRAHAARE
ncbi:hypothetical protein HRW23_01990 [Streptomyces lunaelactis]|uniref:hypothetical protein n=1 Tax=Streptomyces lunaelactis TaxID=1535768 RepID=UPI0015845050|nr:hypothetical protein [Streptomyces lunaelactis]NUK05105.1 hypothetical protein [Streptomyces lunaelactis]NUK19418.1 hypothetical protein [Streptomyces lunaelactis]NUK50519.1 hypothetical protein [Streptomyces lunaelactis]NUK66789.1 hypothetical protein [Streptomyces lunaelactis]NUK73495.1 hypothetical protein [Streptomyces lunaelactis]